MFGPHEAQFTAIAEANLKRKEDELAQAKVVLTYEKEQRALTEAALNAKVLEAEKARDSAQAENSDLKEKLAGKLIFLLIDCFSLGFALFSELLICFLSVLAREKETWLKDREAMTDTLHTSQN